MAQADVTPARALARLMFVAFAAILLTLVLAVSVIGVAGPSDATVPDEPVAAATP